MSKVTINHVLGKFSGSSENSILQRLKDRKHFQNFRKKNFEITKQKLKSSVNDDILITTTIASIGELKKALNMLSKRLREHYELYNPELSKSVQSNEMFAELVLKESQTKDSIGSKFKEKDLSPIMELAKNITRLSKLKQTEEDYIEKKLKEYAPNMVEVAGFLLAAQLLEHTHSLKRLALLPASTIQLLGAEKALFRHLKTKSRCPKHGLIIQHLLIQNAQKKNRGKVARMLADKISIASRIDFFKGEFKGKEIIKNLEKRVDALN